jgi:predicted acylesterase/phospholipase RssA
MIQKHPSNSKNNKQSPNKQRALVLQGGGALGAYEVGVLKTLYKKLTEEDKKNGEEDRLLFDIIAGTSIGAMNGAVLVSQFLKEKEKLESEGIKGSASVCWEKAIDGLERFWKEGIALKEGTTSYHDVPPLKMFPIFSWWAPWTKESPSWAPYTKEKWTKKRLQDGKNINTEDLASEEAARRYYSTKVFVAGAGKVFSFKGTRDDDKFFDEDLTAKWILLNDEPLKKQIEMFGEFPIGTSFENAQPRLLITAVDIAEGVTVTFDSYKKSDGKRKTVYYSGEKYGCKKEDEHSNNNNEHGPNPIIIEYDGITIEHVMASGTLPEYYDPKDICKRKFWDGGLLSNTPLRELLEAHRDYWINIENQDKSPDLDEAPDLDVYIINVHPTRIGLDNIPKKYDEVKDRNSDIIYGDRTYSEQYSTSVIADCVDFIKDLKYLALNHIKEDEHKKAFEKELENLRTREAKNTSYAAGEHTEYKDILRGRFKITKLVRIERKYNPNTSTSFKGGDITSKTIDELIKEGEHDTLISLYK